MAAGQLRLRLLGRPTIEAPDGVDRRLRSRKSWALLAYLVLTETPPSRRLSCSATPSSRGCGQNSGGAS